MEKQKHSQEILFEKTKISDLARYLNEFFSYSYMNKGEIHFK